MDRIVALLAATCLHAEERDRVVAMSLDDAIESLRAYADIGRPTGGFLEAVLSNDLMDAMARADESSRANLHAICSYVYNKLPMNCHGSPEKVAAWLARHAERRKREAEE